ncbi:MAG TPA: hypothetical protein VK176_07535 [Phycisphaerales bacterium]|nr:hypothetical protein [Phycisphaerales bacterium]
MTPNTRSERDESKDLTWAMLLARWTEFARASVALPRKGEQGRWRSAVADIIGLQALAQAMGEVDELVRPGERTLGLDLADIQIKAHARNLHEIWKDAPLPEQLVDLIDDARAMHTACRNAGVEWSVASEQLMAEHPSALVEVLRVMGFKGDLYVPTPGVTLFQTCPAIYLSMPGGEIPDEEIMAVIDAHAGWEGELAEPERMYGMRQAYRQFDFLRGGALRDVVLPVDAGLPGGQPLLVCAIRAGEAQGVTLPPRKSAPMNPLPVEFLEEAPPPPPLPPR